MSQSGKPIALAFWRFLLILLAQDFIPLISRKLNKMLRPNDQIGPYTLIRPLGAGNFGEVWLAERRGELATVQVAVKFPRLVIEEDETDFAATHEKQRRAIAAEAAIWTKASGHTNVLPIIEADVIEGHLAIVSEYASGGSLSKWLAVNGGKAPSETAAVEMMSGILRGLEHLHRRGIVHRDLKPGNILLQEDIPRLTDFGISRLLDAESSRSLVSGTYAYMSPEALDGVRSEQTDVWSAGVIFYRMLAGHLPFPEKEPMALIKLIQTSDFAPLPETVSPRLKEIVNKALEKKTENRFASAAAMKNALLAFAPRTDSLVKSLDHEDLTTIEDLEKLKQQHQEAEKFREQQGKDEQDKNQREAEELNNGQNEEEEPNEDSSNKSQSWTSQLKSVLLFMGALIVLLPIIIIIGEWFTPPPEPTPKPIPEPHISISGNDGASNLNLKFSGLQLFECPLQVQPRAERRYSTNFVEPRTRFICAENHIEYSTANIDRSFTLTFLWYKINASTREMDTLISSFNQDFTTHANETGSYFITGEGAEKYGGKWSPGNYRVDVFWNSKLVGSQTFSVTNSDSTPPNSNLSVSSNSNRR